MIDFNEYGYIKVHKKFTEMNDDVIQFFPIGLSYGELEQNLSEMVKLLDKGLTERNLDRGILIRSCIDYPTPCIIIFNYELDSHP
tara:strand:+ start:3247 stop:3501 length:255 start_codon:yes stop_codon:yes gene_type:complete